MGDLLSAAHLDPGRDRARHAGDQAEHDRGERGDQQGAAARLTGRYELRIGADTFAVDGSSGSVRIRRGTADQPDATATTDLGTFHAVIFGQRAAADAIASGDLRLDGSPAAADGLTDLLLASAPVPAAGA